MTLGGLRPSVVPVRRRHPVSCFMQGSHLIRLIPCAERDEVLRHARRGPRGSALRRGHDDLQAYSSRQLLLADIERREVFKLVLQGARDVQDI